MPKQILTGQDARNQILKGVRILARAVKATLGPQGRTVLLERSYGSPLVTKDGVSVAREIDLEDPVMTLGGQMVREAASKTSAVVGDGTTTATVLAEAIFSEGLKNVAAGANPLGIRRGIEKAVETVVAYLKDKSRPIEGHVKIAQVASIAANQDMAIGEMVARAMDKVGKDGAITVEEGKTLHTEVEFIDGMQFDKGYISPYFVTNDADMECILENPFVLVHEKKISRIQDLLPILEKISEAGKSLLVIAEDVDGEALSTLVVNKLRGTLSCAAVKAPGFGEGRKSMLQDIALLTAGKAIFEDLGSKIENLQIEDLGRARKVIVNKDSTTIIQGAGKADDIEGRIRQIRREIEDATSDHDKEKLKERLSRLAGGVARINLGAATEAEMKEKKARVDNALNATRAAVEEGVLPGGGVALLRSEAALKKLEVSGDEAVGVAIVRRALASPLAQIAQNAGVNGAIAVQKVAEMKNFDHGFNADTCKYENLVKAGIVDPTKVVRTALQNAASVAVLLLTTEAVVSRVREKNDGER
jgi:chaperonin GroEL